MFILIAELDWLDWIRLINNDIVKCFINQSIICAFAVTFSPSLVSFSSYSDIWYDQIFQNWKPTLKITLYNVSWLLGPSFEANRTLRDPTILVLLILTLSSVLWFKQYTITKYGFEFIWKIIIMTSSNGNMFRFNGPLCGEFTGPGELPAQRPVTRSFDVFFYLRLNKRLSKQPWGWWFETSPWSLWRQCNECLKLPHPRVSWNSHLWHNTEAWPKWLSFFRLHFKIILLRKVSYLIFF